MSVPDDDVLGSSMEQGLGGDDAHRYGKIFDPVWNSVGRGLDWLNGDHEHCDGVPDGIRLLVG